MSPDAFVPNDRLWPKPDVAERDRDVRFQGVQRTSA